MKTTDTTLELGADGKTVDGKALALPAGGETRTADRRRANSFHEGRKQLAQFIVRAV